MESNQPGATGRDAYEARVEAAFARVFDAEREADAAVRAAQIEAQARQAQCDAAIAALQGSAEARLSAWRLRASGRFARRIAACDAQRSAYELPVALDETQRQRLSETAANLADRLLADEDARD